MKLVITTDSFLPRLDGVARFLSQLIPALGEHDITVIAPAFPGEIPLLKAKLIRFPLRPFRFGDIHFARPDKSVMESIIKDADLVFNQTIGPIGRAGIKIGKRLGKPVISYVHSIDWELAARALSFGSSIVLPLVRLYARSLYNTCTRLMVPSREVADILSLNSITTQKTIVPLGIDSTVFTPLPKSVCKKALGIAPETFVVGYCGRIAREKDLPTLYSAFGRIRRNHPTVALLIVGEGREVPCLPGLIAVGRKDDVVPYLSAMDAFVLPSLTETSSLATMEAMAISLPVVVTPVGNISEYVRPFVNGLFFAQRNVDELTRHIERLIEDKALRMKLGRNARRTILTSYAFKNTVKQLKSILATYAS